MDFKHNEIDFDSFKYEVLFAELNELRNEDENLKKAFHVHELKQKHPSLYQLLLYCQQDSICFNLNKEQFALLEKRIESKTQLILDCLTLKNCDSLSKAEFVQLFTTEVDQFVAETECDKNLENKMQRKIQCYEKLYIDYLEKLRKYYEEFGLGFKISFDKLRAESMCAKTQAWCAKRRLEETRAFVSKYGDIETIEKAKADRERLGEENRQLRSKLNDMKEVLKTYECLDSDLLRQYEQLKEDLAYKRWALEQLETNNSLSSAATNDSQLDSSNEESS